jgi:molecular chaperone GrpE
MNPDHTKAPRSGGHHPAQPQAPEAELPQAPPGAPEGHDAVTPGEAIPPAGTTPPVDGAVPGPAPAAAASREPEVAPEPGKPAPQGAESPSTADLDTLTAKAHKADEYLAMAQRTQADFENYRKRAVREAAAAQERGAVKLALSLLPAIDNLERALAHVDTSETQAGAESNGTDSLVAGIKHVHADVIAALGRVGIECYSPEGEQFDPQYHEAVAQQPVQGTEPGVVVEVFQRGYRMGENVVRPARVVVAG